MSTQSQFSATAQPHVPLVPPLESGDCLSREEFERRYTAMPWLKKAELIEGVVFVGSPVSEPHADCHARLMVLLGVYAAQTSGVRCNDNVTVRLGLTSEIQPDVLLRVISGGQSKVGPAEYIEGGPELVAEVALTSASRDLHSKLALYQRHGVREYLVWRVLENELDWFVLRSSDYQPTAPNDAGLLRSEVFPGLWLDKPALLRGEMASVLATLSRGLASSEHAAFVARMAEQQ